MPIENVPIETSKDKVPVVLGVAHIEGFALDPEDKSQLVIYGHYSGLNPDNAIGQAVFQVRHVSLSADVQTEVRKEVQKRLTEDHGYDFGTDAVVRML